MPFIFSGKFSVFIFFNTAFPNSFLLSFWNFNWTCNTGPSHSIIILFQVHDLCFIFSHPIIFLCGSLGNFFTFYGGNTTLAWRQWGRIDVFRVKADTQRADRRRQWHPTPVLLPGKSHGWRSLAGYSPQGRKKSDMTERLHTHTQFIDIQFNSCAQLCLTLPL